MSLRGRMAEEQVFCAGAGRLRSPGRGNLEHTPRERSPHFPQGCRSHEVPGTGKSRDRKQINDGQGPEGEGHTGGH